MKPANLIGATALVFLWAFAVPQQVATQAPADEDRDGVADSRDACPRTPPETKVDDRGCPLQPDGDRDGVPDTVDRCPNTRANARPVDATGCPVDTDRDGVADYLDRCANTAPNTQVQANGCAVQPDADSDGVPDWRDDCPNSAAGAVVDGHGCPRDPAPAPATHRTMYSARHRQPVYVSRDTVRTIDGVRVLMHLRAGQSVRVESCADGWCNVRAMPASGEVLSGPARGLIASREALSEQLRAMAVQMRATIPDLDPLAVFSGFVPEHSLAEDSVASRRSGLADRAVQLGRLRRRYGGLGERVLTSLVDGRIAVGMSRELVDEFFGPPDRAVVTETAAGERELRYYGSDLTVEISRGRVVAVRRDVQP